LFFVVLQVAQVLLTLPYSFSQLGMLSGVLLQIFYGFLGSWTAYLISVLYVEYRSRKEKEGVSFKNHVIQVWLLASLPPPPTPPSPDSTFSSPPLKHLQLTTVSILLIRSPPSGLFFLLTKNLLFFSSRVWRKCCLLRKRERGYWIPRPLVCMLRCAACLSNQKPAEPCHGCRSGLGEFHDPYLSQKPFVQLTIWN